MTTTDDWPLQYFGSAELINQNLIKNRIGTNMGTSPSR